MFKNLKILNLFNNLISNISVIKDLNNLEELYLNNNLITDISDIKYLTDLKTLDIDNLELKSSQIKYIKSIKKLERLYSVNGFEDISVLNQLNKNIEVIK